MSLRGYVASWRHQIMLCVSLLGFCPDTSVPRNRIPNSQISRKFRIQDSNFSQRITHEPKFSNNGKMKGLIFTRLYYPIKKRRKYIRYFDLLISIQNMYLPNHIRVLTDCWWVATCDTVHNWLYWLTWPLFYIGWAFFVGIDLIIASRNSNQST